MYLSVFGNVFALTIPLLMNCGGHTHTPVGLRCFVHEFGRNLIDQIEGLHSETRSAINNLQPYLPTIDQILLPGVWCGLSIEKGHQL